MSLLQSPSKNPLDKSESGEWKSWLKAQHSENEDHGIRSHHFMGNRWGNSGNCQTLFWGGGLQNHCRWWLQPNSIFKSRDITLPTKVRLVKIMVFPVVMYGCESRTVKKAECRRIDAFELWCGEDSWESLGLQGDPTSPFGGRSTLGFLWKEWC